ncbi:MAG: hypothetical protein ABI208_05595, partial [Ginsengibacter sp.]
MNPFRSSISSFLLIFILLVVLSGCTSKKSVELTPGYNKSELLAILPAMERTYDSADIGGFLTPEPENIKQVFRSKESPLKNRFDVWLTNDNQAVITIRGSIIDSAGLSFTAALYALMVPATGKIKISETSTFEYKLAELPDAGVHLGMLLGLYFISGDLVNQINSQYKNGVKDFIIVGHSQGSGISLLATSYLWYLRKSGQLPADIRFKTYSIATPKTGNLQYVYDYEKLTAGGYALSVNNVLDWVPYIGITLESGQDFPKISPFKNIKAFLTDIHYPPGPNFEKGFEQFSTAVPQIVEQVGKIIHESVYPRVLKVIPGFVEPKSLPTLDFERSGVSVPLVPNQEY